MIFPQPIANFEKDDFTSVIKFPHITQQSIMPVCSIYEESIRPVGTCFAVSNHGLVLTARHVIDEALGIDKENPQGNGSWIGAIYIAEPRDNDDIPDLLGGLLPVNKVHIIPSLDVAVMHLNLPVRVDDETGLPMPALRLSPGLPEIGSTCLALGYHSMEGRKLHGEMETHEIVQSYSATRGKIEENHLPIRDPNILNFPCFRTSSRFDGGMSGGPIMNESGGVVGVVCSSYGSIENGPHLSYGSLIGPSLLLVIDSLEDGIEKKKFLYDFYLGKSIGIDETISKVEIIRNENSIELIYKGHCSISNNLD